MNKLFYLLLVIPFTIISCDSNIESSDNSEEFTGEINTPDAIAIDSNEFKIYPLPTPLQVVTILNSFNFDYNTDLLINKNIKVNYPTATLRALNLGINTIDLGYTTVYKTSSDIGYYFRNVKQLMTDLGIDDVVTNPISERFQSNLNNRDSLSRIILETYSDAHQYFEQNDKEGLGLLILTGCYIEGLYILCNVSKKNKDNEMLQNLIGQHKLFLESITELMGYYTKAKEIQDLLLKLKNLKKRFEKITVDYRGTGRFYCKISPEQIKEVNLEISKIRNQIIN